MLSILRNSWRCRCDNNNSRNDYSFHVSAPREKKTSYRYASASHRVGGSTRTAAGRLLDSEERDADSLGQIDTVSSILSTLHSVTDVADKDVRYIDRKYRGCTQVDRYRYSVTTRPGFIRGFIPKIFHLFPLDKLCKNSKRKYYGFLNYTFPVHTFTVRRPIKHCICYHSTCRCRRLQNNA